MRPVWFRLVASPNTEAYVVYDVVTLSEDASMHQLQNAVKGAHEQDIMLSGVAASYLKVYKNSTAIRDGNFLCKTDEPLGACGEIETDPVIVRIPQVWYQLVDSDAMGVSEVVFMDSWSVTVPLTGNHNIGKSLNAVHEKHKTTLRAGVGATSLMAYSTNGGIHGKWPDTLLEQTSSVDGDIF